MNLSAKVADLVAQGMGRNRIASELDITQNQAQYYIKKARGKKAADVGEADLNKRVKRLLTNADPMTVAKMADQLDVAPKHVRAALKDLEASARAPIETPEGFVLPKAPELTKPREATIEESGQWRQFALISDTHGASRHEQLVALHQFYDECEREGVTHVFHAGDMTHGRKVYTGIDHDIKIHSYPGQVRHVVRTYPKRKGIVTHFICGNHDFDAVKHDSEDPGEAIARERDDLIYLGMYSGSINYQGLRIQLQHGGGSPSYALSYKIQKYLEKLPRTETKPPHIYSLGHYHTGIYIPKYQGVDAFLPGAFEGQNELLKRLGIYPVPGGFIVEARLDGDVLRDVKFRFITFPLEHGNIDEGTASMAAE